MSFTFKHFHIDDAHCSMKVGTDGVLLGAWSPILHATHILDIGCGCGLISLMAAQRVVNAQITGVEIDAAAVTDAELNVRRSPFGNRINIIKQDAIQFARNSQTTFDCILSNPPYYEEDVLPPSALRAKARHTAGGGLTFEALLHSVDLLLDKSAHLPCFCIILPSKSVEKFITLSSLHGLFLAKRTDVLTRPHKPCKRVLLCFTTKATTLITDKLFLIDGNGKRTAQYQELCKDFYL